MPEVSAAEDAEEMTEEETTSDNSQEDATAEDNGSVVFEGGPAGSAVYTLYKDGTLVVAGDAEGKTDEVQEYLDKDLNITKIVIEPGVTEVSSNAFSQVCENVTELELPDSLETIGEKAFMYIGIEELILPGNVKKIGGRAFTGSRVSKVVFPEGLESLSDAFFGCEYIKEMTVPGSIKTITSNFFGKCQALEKATFEEGIEFLNSDVFYDCTNLKEVYLPFSLTEIRDTHLKCDVYYAGSESDWNNIKFDNRETYTSKATMHFGK